MYVIFSRWNEARLNIGKRKRIVPAVETYVPYVDTDTTPEYFGLGFTHTDLFVTDNDECDSPISNINKTKPDAEDVDAESDADDDEDDDDDDESTEQKTKGVINNITDLEINRAITRAKDFSELCEHILKMGKNIRFNISFISLLKSSLYLLSPSTMKENSNYTKQLIDNLGSHKLNMVNNDTDNSYAAFANEIVSYIQREELNSIEMEQLEEKSMTSNAQEMPLLVENLIKNEVQKVEMDYTSLMSSNDASAPVLRCVPLALCNALRIQIVIFTGMLNIPIIPLSPNEPKIFRKPLYIAYQPNNFRQVMQILVEDVDSGRNEKEKPGLTTENAISCRCGSGAKKGSGLPSCNKFAGCKCFQIFKSCSNCKCVNCANPNGTPSNIEVSSKPAKRIRRRHDHTTERETDCELLKRLNSKPVPAKWSTFEQIFLFELSHIAIKKDILDIDKMCIIVQQLNTHDTQCLSKSRTEIRKQILHAINTDYVYQKLLKEQLRMNIM